MQRVEHAVQRRAVRQRPSQHSVGRRDRGRQSQSLRLVDPYRTADVDLHAGAHALMLLPSGHGTLAVPGVTGHRPNGVTRRHRRDTAGPTAGVAMLRPVTAPPTGPPQRVEVSVSVRTVMVLLGIAVLV